MIPPDDPDELSSVELEQNLSDLRDADADRRDVEAEVRDRYAEIRDHNAQVREERLSGQPDPEGGRRQAAKDRRAAANDRAASDGDRGVAQVDRRLSGWDRSDARQREAQLLRAVNESADVAGSTLLIGQALGVLMQALDADPLRALIELEDRAARQHVGLPEAARQIIAEYHNSVAASDRRLLAVAEREPGHDLAERDRAAKADDQYAEARDSEAEHDDQAAAARDVAADRRDARAENRESATEVDRALSERRVAAEDRQEAAEDRDRARGDRVSSHQQRERAGEDRGAAHDAVGQLRALLFRAEDDAAGAWVIAKAQGMIMTAHRKDPLQALLELATRAARDGCELQDAARSIMAEVGG